MPASAAHEFSVHLPRSLMRTGEGELSLIRVYRFVCSLFPGRWRKQVVLPSPFVRSRVDNRRINDSARFPDRPVAKRFFRIIARRGAVDVKRRSAYDLGVWFAMLSTMRMASAPS